MANKHVWISTINRWQKTQLLTLININIPTKPDQTLISSMLIHKLVPSTGVTVYVPDVPAIWHSQGFEYRATFGKNYKSGEKDKRREIHKLIACTERPQVA